MVSSTCQLVACVILIFSTTIYALSQTTSVTTPGASISGKVTIKGKGAPGIAVGLISEVDSNYKATRFKGFTDEAGNYRITNVPAGKYRVSAAAPAFVGATASDSLKPLLINKNETVENIDVALVRGGVITGRVTDSEGRPIIEESVSISLVEQKDGFFHDIPWQNQTDDRGIYRIFGVPAGVYRVAAGQDESGSFSGSWSRAGYRRTFHPATLDASQATPIEVSEGSETTNVDITLTRPIVKYSARGRIVDGKTGQPLANIPYAVTMFINQHSTSTLTTGAVSNSDGEFKLDNLEAGQYAVVVEPPPDTDWRSEGARFEVRDQDVSGLVIKTSKGASISGVIVLEGIDDPTILANLLSARVYASVFNANSSGNSTQSATIKPDGSFRIGGLQAGLAHFGISTRGFAVVRVERNGVLDSGGLEIKEQEQLNGLRLIVNHRNGSIRGVMKLASGTLPANGRFTVSFKRLAEVSGPFGEGYGDSVDVDARGQFSEEGLLPGTYEVRAAVYVPNEFHSKMPQAKQQVIVNAGATTNITLTLQPQP